MDGWMDLLGFLLSQVSLHSQDGGERIVDVVRSPGFGGEE